jgi:hypothetical protein
VVKKDLNYIRHVRPQVKRQERNDRYYKDTRKIYAAQQELERRIINANAKHAEICKKASCMSIEERLIAYNITKDGTYLGTGCNWDYITRLGKKCKQKILGVIY